jgi:hypothetical protein
MITRIRAHVTPAHPAQTNKYAAFALHIALHIPLHTLHEIVCLFIFFPVRTLLSVYIFMEIEIAFSEPLHFGFIALLSFWLN